MAGFKRTLIVSIGMTQVTCDLLSVKKAGDNDLMQVCTGNGTHPPAKPCWDPVCETCGTVSRDTLAKAREIVEGQYVVFGQSEIDALKEDEARYKGQMALTAHPLAEVTGKTERNGTTYVLVPSTKKGVPDQSAFYAVLRALLVETPDVAYMARYTVTSRAAIYKLRLHGNVILADQMVPTDEYAELPEFTLPDVPEPMLAMVRDYAAAYVTPFDPSAYENEYAARLTAAIATREAVEAGQVAVEALARVNVDPFAAMQEMMASAIAAQPKPAPAKAAPAKKAAAQKPRKTAKAS